MKEISVIIPSIGVSNGLKRLVSSIRGLSEAAEIIVVVPRLSYNNVISELVDTNSVVIAESSVGIYSAMNDGIRGCTRDYIMFFGDDDILLGLPNIQYINEGYDLIIHDVFWGDERIYRNLRNRYSLLVRNWCHQGLVFSRSVFERNGLYGLNYRYQEDHNFNINLAFKENMRIVKSKQIISWYSAQGISTRQIDVRFREDFPEIVEVNMGRTLGRLLMLKRYIFG